MTDDLRKIVVRANPAITGQLGFRLVGSRHSGVFVYSIQDEYKHPGGLEIGDRLLQCEKIPLQGRTPEQVAAILRFSLNRQGHIFVIVKRETEIRERLENQRRLADKENLHPSFHDAPLDDAEDGENELMEGVEEEDFNSRPVFPDDALPDCLPGVSSASAEHSDFNSPDPFEIPSPKKMLKRRMIKSFTTEDRLLLIACAADSDMKTFGIMEKEEYEYDYSSGKFRCPICFKQTDLKRLHQLRHIWRFSARRLLPFSFSDYAIL